MQPETTSVTFDHQVQVSQQNLHPFRCADVPLCLAHNGDLALFDEMKYDLLAYIRPAVAQQIRGTTDSEWIYAVLLSQFDDPCQRQQSIDLVHAVEKTLTILRRVRQHVGISQSSSVNLFLCDGENLVATRVTFDFGCYTANGLKMAKCMVDIPVRRGAGWKARTARPTTTF